MYYVHALCALVLIGQRVYWESMGIGGDTLIGSLPLLPVYMYNDAPYWRISKISPILADNTKDCSIFKYM